MFALICFFLLALCAGFTVRLRDFQILGILAVCSLTLLFLGAADAYQSVRPVGPPTIVLSILWVVVAVPAWGLALFLHDGTNRTLQVVFGLLACTVAVAGIMFRFL